MGGKNDLQRLLGAARTVFFGVGDAEADTLPQQHSQQAATSHGYIAVACLPDDVNRRVPIEEVRQRFVDGLVKNNKRLNYTADVKAAGYKNIFEDIYRGKLIIVAQDHRIDVSVYMDMYGLDAVNIYVVVNVSDYLQLYSLTIRNKGVFLGGESGFLGEYNRLSSILIGHGDVLVFRVR